MTAPVTDRDVSVPTDVMLGCAASMSGSWPTMFEAGMFVSPEPDPEKVPEVVVPVTARDVSVPTEVMFDCAGTVTTAASGTVPVTFAPESAERPAPLPIKTPVADVTFPVTVRVVSVPREVMFDCAGTVTTAASGTVPVTFAPVNKDRPVPTPTNDPLVVILVLPRNNVFTS